MARARAEYEITAKDKTGRATASIKKGFKSVDRAANVVANAVGVLVPAAFVILIAKVTEADDRLSKMAFNLGFTTEALSEFEFVAGISGVKTESLLTSVKRLQKNVSDAEVGLTTAIRAFEALGISSSKLIKLAPEEQFERVVLALGNLEDQSVRTRVAQDLFGRSGVELIKIATLGASGIAKLKTEARLLGGVLAGDVAEATEEWNDATLRIKTAILGVARQSAALRNQELTELVNDFAFKIPAAAYATGRGFDELALKLGTLGKAISQEFTERGFLAKAMLATPIGYANFINDVVGTFREDLGKELAEFDKETQEQLDKIFNFKFPDRTNGGAGGSLITDISIIDKDVVEEAEEVVSRFLLEHTQALETATEQWRDLENNVVNYGEAVDEASEETEDLDNIAQDLGLTFSSAFEDAVLGGKNFRDVLGGIFEDIQRIILRKTITEPIGKFFSEMIGSIDFGEMFGGGKAGGGPVSGGVTYLVGEQGPELFTPGRSGGITPNGALGAPVIQITNTVDARGADAGSDARIRAAMQETEERTIARITELFQRDPGFLGARG